MLWLYPCCFARKLTEEILSVILLLVNSPAGLVKFDAQDARTPHMPLRLTLTIVVAGLELQAYPRAGFSETRVLSNEAGSPAVSESARGGGCCLIESPAAPDQLGPEGSRVPSAQSPSPSALEATSTDVQPANVNREGDNAADATTPAAQTDPGNVGVAQVAAPPESLWRRILGAVMDFGETETAKR